MRYEEKATEILTKIRAIAREIEGFRAPVSATEMRALVRHATVPAAFVEQTAVAVEATPELARAQIFDPDEAREARAFNTCCQTIAQELEITGRGVRYAGLKRLAASGDAALRVLVLAKALNRGSLVVPYVDAMQKTLRSRRRKSRQEQDGPESEDPSPSGGITDSGR